MPCSNAHKSLPACLPSFSPSSTSLLDIVAVTPHSEMHGYPRVKHRLSVKYEQGGYIVICTHSLHHLCLPSLYPSSHLQDIVVVPLLVILPILESGVR